MKGILRKGHGLVRLFVCVHQISNIHRDNDRDIFIVTDIVRQLKQHRAIQILLKINRYIAV